MPEKLDPPATLTPHLEAHASAGSRDAVSDLEEMTNFIGMVQRMAFPAVEVL